MGALLVVGCHPFVDALADFAEGGEQVRIDDLAPEGPVEAFNTGVLRGLAGRGASMLEVRSLLKNRARQRIPNRRWLDERLRRGFSDGIPCGRRALFQKASLRRS